MANTNSNMHKAKSAKNDEFYTMLTDIEKEMKYYRDQFKGKTIYCNCDDARESNFFKYFSLNFEFLGLKKLISTSYKENGKGVVLIYEGDKNGNKIVEDSEIEVKELEGNGDFRSEECIEYLKQADIVVTNPPFSLFRDFISLIMKYGKKFLILGNNNAITYNEVFPYFVENKIWLGYASNKTMRFTLSNDYEKWEKIENGKKIGKVPAISWFTNLYVNKSKAEIVLTKRYDSSYNKFDGFDAINVGKLTEIPYDYEGIMGVPLTAMNYLNSDGHIYFDVPNEGRIVKYKVVGEINHGMGCEYDFAKCFVNGKEIFKRIAIQKVK